MHSLAILFSIIAASAIVQGKDVSKDVSIPCKLLNCGKSGVDMICNGKAANSVESVHLAFAGVQKQAHIPRDATTVMPVSQVVSVMNTGVPQSLQKEMAANPAAAAESLAKQFNNKNSITATWYLNLPPPITTFFATYTFTAPPITGTDAAAAASAHNAGGKPKHKNAAVSAKVPKSLLVAGLVGVTGVLALALAL